MILLVVIPLVLQAIQVLYTTRCAARPMRSLVGGSREALGFLLLLAC